MNYFYLVDNVRYEYELGTHYIYAYNQITNKLIDLYSFDWKVNKTKLTEKQFLSKCKRYHKEMIENK